MGLKLPTKMDPITSPPLDPLLARNPPVGLRHATHPVPSLLHNIPVKFENMFRGRDSPHALIMPLAQYCICMKCEITKMVFCAFAVIVNLFISVGPGDELCSDHTLRPLLPRILPQEVALRPRDVPHVPPNCPAEPLGSKPGLWPPGGRFGPGRRQTGSPWGRGGSEPGQQPAQPLPEWKCGCCGSRGRAGGGQSGLWRRWRETRAAGRAKPGSSRPLLQLHGRLCRVLRSRPQPRPPLQRLHPARRPRCKEWSGRVPWRWRWTQTDEWPEFISPKWWRERRDIRNQITSWKLRTFDPWRFSKLCWELCIFTLAPRAACPR